MLHQVTIGWKVRMHVQADFLLENSKAITYHGRDLYLQITRSKTDF